MYIKHNLLTFLSALAICSGSLAQDKVSFKNPDTMVPQYAVSYIPQTASEVKADVDRVKNYLAENTIPGINGNGKLVKTKYRLANYEWGVTYQSMLFAYNVTGDKSYLDYVTERFNFIAQHQELFPKLTSPHMLDDTGAMITGMIKALMIDPSLPVRPLIETGIHFIMEEEYRLSSGLLARNTPYPNTVWLDDMYMGIPAIAWYGRLTGDKKYYDEALRQIRLFYKMMWVADKNLFRHGRVTDMEDYTPFFWGRANGWAILTLSEVLDAMPESYKGRKEVLAIFKQHAKGLSALQAKDGMWHQLLDKEDSYLESSATAIYTYCFAHGINEGWLDSRSFGPVALLGWNGLRERITAEGAVEGICVGTNMGFDPAFYYYRPASELAEHGYGPTIFAGAEVMRLISKHTIKTSKHNPTYFDQPQK